MTTTGRGCLDGIRVLELGGKGPTPFAGMLLADMGASVVRLDRPGLDRSREGVDVALRGKQVLELDLRDDVSRTAVETALADFDVVIVGLRAGTAERWGLGGDEVLDRHPHVVYAQLSGYGREGRDAARAGHDVNFVAMSGMLGHLGAPGSPPPLPLNVVADFGGAGMALALGVLGGLVERGKSGAGQVVDVAMSDATALLLTGLYGMRGGGEWVDQRESNLVDGGAPFYGVYATADERYVAVGAIEADQFAALVHVCGLGDKVSLDRQFDREDWPRVRGLMAASFAEARLDEWLSRFAEWDACVTPVLSMASAPEHPYHRERGTFVEVDGVVQPAPAPRFTRTPSRAGAMPVPSRDLALLAQPRTRAGSG